jgi:hypothetical protein
LVEAAVLDERQGVLVDRKLNVAELGAVQGDHVVEDGAQARRQRVLAEQPSGHLRKHGKQKSPALGPSEIRTQR